MNWWENLNSILAGLLTALLGVIAFFVRKILTNERRISMLETEIENREEYRKERDELINSQLAEIRNDIKRLIGKMTADYQDQK